MRRSEAGLGGLALALLAATGCAFPLNGEFAGDASYSGPIDGGPATEVLPGCLLFGGPSAALTQLSGQGRDVDLGDGGRGWVFDSALPGSMQSPLVQLTPGQVGQECALRWAIDVRPIPAFVSVGDGGAIDGPLDGVRVAGQTSLFFAQDKLDPTAFFGVTSVGFGVALQTESAGFAPAPALLFTSDRPDYGSAVVAQGGMVFAFGCRNGSGFLESDCSVSRVAEGSLQNASDYAFSIGGGQWSSDPDSAAVLFQGASDLSVTFDEITGEFWLTYIPPLGNQLTFRWALAPDGPWSGPIVLGDCELPTGDPDAFCGAAIQHPEDRDEVAGTLAVSYGIDTLNPDAGLLRAAAPATYWPRLVTLTIPVH
jgi:Domain of unknown function (DUF4185)